MKKTLLTERFQQLAGIKPLYENKRLNEGVPLEKLMKGDKLNNNVLVVPNISFKDEKELRRKAMRPVDFDDAFGPRSQVEFTNVGGESGTPVFGVEDGVVQDVILFDDALKNLNESLNEFKEGEDFGLWFRAGVRGEKQIQQAKDLLTQNGIEFNTPGRFGIGFKGKGYEKEEIVQLLRDNGLTRFVIYDYENELEEEQSQTDKHPASTIASHDILTDDERDYAFDVLSKMHQKLNPTLDVEKTRIIIDFAEAVLQEFYE